ncbi:hypothetical protein L1987_24875 [Smallanthus sonchifolius]|uniref:Uncharacterized protein n=1 Tax=Smallanthus sonchifolius TaxID=185202 RepID=A0ACB9ILF6_9ASTR|nr:hypothetical protein L1987_24875 [Smallanthus sonchifolius]
MSIRTGSSTHTRGRKKQAEEVLEKEAQATEMQKMINKGIEDAIPTMLEAFEKAQTFQACKPYDFLGKKGGVATLRWIEKTESVLALSKCAKEDKVLYDSNLFKNFALEWWNALVSAKGRERAYRMSWDSFKDRAKRKFCPINEVEQIEQKFLNLRMVGSNHQDYMTKLLEYARLVLHLATPELNIIKRYIYGLVSEIRDMVKVSKPKTIDDAMDIGAQLMDGMIRTMEENKRKETFSRWKVDFKKTNQGSSTRERKFSIPECKICKKRHLGKCRLLTTCPECKCMGYHNNQCPRMKVVTCYNCDETGHYKSECPNLKATGGSGTKPTTEAKKNARAFRLNAKEADKMTDVIYGTFLVDNAYAKVLFDSGATQSFIDHKLCKLFDKPLAKLDKTYQVKTANGDLIQVAESLNGCSITLSGHVIPIQLLQMDLDGFDIVLGMDWLATNEAHILCDSKVIELRTPSGEIVTIKGDKSTNPVGLISMIKATKYLRKGCLAYLISVTTCNTERELKDVPIVSKYPDIFPEELPRTPPDREVEFCINLVPGTAPIAKSPYRLAPTEMAELKK